MKLKLGNTVLFLSVVLNPVARSVAFAADHTLPVPIADSGLTNGSQPLVPAVKGKPDPAMGSQSGAWKAQIVGSFAPGGDEKSMRSCTDWKAAFEHHFRQIEELYKAMRVFENSLEARPPTSADELTKSDWRKQSFALQDQAAKKLDEVRRAVEEFSPEEFFDAEPARVEWSGSAKVHGLAFSELQTIAGLRLVTSREQK